MEKQQQQQHQQSKFFNQNVINLKYYNPLNITYNRNHDFENHRISYIFQNIFKI